MPDIIVEVNAAPPILVEINGDTPTIEVFPTPGLGGGGNGQVERLDISRDGQTQFTLSFIVVSPHLSQLYLNGEKVSYPADYTIDSTQLTWLGIELETDDELELYN
jgi:hypothetical protein